MRVEQLRGDLDRRQQQQQQQQPGNPFTKGVHSNSKRARCPACRKSETESRGDFKARAMRCICRAADFSMQCAAAGRQ